MALLRWRYFKYIALVCLCILLFTGCSHYIPQPDDPRFTPIIPDVAAEVKPQGGSLFIADNGLSLYQDMKAHRVGDIITVKLVESTKASKDAKTNLKKEYSNETKKSPSILGGNPKFLIHKVLPFLKTKDTKTLDMDVDNEMEFKGTGDSNQNNSLTGDITVTVSQVLPNKNLVIRGEKWITLNKGSEYIRLTGIVRSQDIGPNNEVLSNRIANARITYSGTGEINDANRIGWLGKFFNSAVWPF